MIEGDIQGTAWAALQAVSEYAGHHHSTRTVEVTPGGGEGDAQDVVLRPWNQAEEAKQPAARTKTERSGPRRRREQAPPPQPEPPVQSEGGGDPSPPDEAPG